MTGAQFATTACLLTVLGVVSLLAASGRSLAQVPPPVPTPTATFISPPPGAPATPFFVPPPGLQPNLVGTPTSAPRPPDICVPTTNSRNASGGETLRLVNNATITLPVGGSYVYNPNVGPPGDPVVAICHLPTRATVFILVNSGRESGRYDPDAMGKAVLDAVVASFRGLRPPSTGDAGLLVGASSTGFIGETAAGR